MALHNYILYYRCHLQKIFVLANSSQCFIIIILEYFTLLYVDLALSKDPEVYIYYKLYLQIHFYTIPFFTPIFPQLAFLMSSSLYGFFLLAPH